MERLPEFVDGEALGHTWRARLALERSAGTRTSYVSGMTLRWQVDVGGQEGPAVQLLGPPSPAAAIRELRRVVESWLKSRSPEAP